MVKGKYEYTAQKDTIDLYALEARYRGEGTYYDWKRNAATDLYAKCYWFLQNVKPGTYAAKIEYACKEEDAGSPIVCSATSEYISDKTQVITDRVIQNTDGKFQMFELPDIEIKKTTTMLAFSLGDTKSVKAEIARIILYKNPSTSSGTN